MNSPPFCALGSRRDDGGSHSGDFGYRRRSRQESTDKFHGVFQGEASFDSVFGHDDRKVAFQFVFENVEVDRVADAPAVGGISFCSKEIGCTVFYSPSDDTDRKRE